MNKDATIITLDVDWVSDEIILYCIEIFKKASLKTTWFITHDSPVIRELFTQPDLFEIGIHPNFLHNSSQGKNVTDVMNYLLNICPNAKIMRTHSLIQSTPIFESIIENYSNIKIDVSLFLPNATWIETHKLYLNSKYITRIPYIWEDDFEMMMPEHLKNFNFKARFNNVSGVKVFDFHPIHIVLNSNNFSNYTTLKDKCNISNIRLKQALKYRNTEVLGTQNFLEELIYSGNYMVSFKDLNLD